MTSARMLLGCSRWSTNGTRKLRSYSVIVAKCRFFGASDRVVAAGNGRDPAYADLPHFFLNLLDVARAAFWRSVAAIHETVHENLQNVLLLGHLEQRVKMREQGVHTAVAA